MFMLYTYIRCSRMCEKKCCKCGKIISDEEYIFKNITELINNKMEKQFLCPEHSAIYEKLHKQGNEDSFWE